MYSFLIRKTGGEVAHSFAVGLPVKAGWVILLLHLLEKTGIFFEVTPFYSPFS